MENQYEYLVGEDKKEQNNIALGLIGAFIGAIIGALPWAIASYFGWIVWIFGPLPIITALFGMKLLYKKENFLTYLVVFIFSVISIIFAEYSAWIIWLMVDIRTYFDDPITLFETVELMNLLLRYDTEFATDFILTLLPGGVALIVTAISTAFQKNKNNDMVDLEDINDIKYFEESDQSEDVLPEDDFKS